MLLPFTHSYNPEAWETSRLPYLLHTCQSFCSISQISLLSTCPCGFGPHDSYSFTASPISFRLVHCGLGQTGGWGGAAGGILLKPTSQCITCLLKILLCGPHALGLKTSLHLVACEVPQAVFNFSLCFPLHLPPLPPSFLLSHHTQLPIGVLLSLLLYHPGFA